MTRILNWLTEEFYHLVPVYLFFLAAFNLINLTTALMAEPHRLTTFNLVIVALGAAVVAKVTLIVDHLPIARLFATQPLLYGILWKTSLYTVIAGIVRYLEHFLPFLVQYHDVAVAQHHFLLEVPWRVFWGVQIWTAVLFFVYVTCQDLFLTLGLPKVRQLFLGRQPSPDA